MGWLSNPTLLLGIAVETLLIVATIYITPLARVFNHEPLPAVFWPGLILFAPILYGLEWLRKFLARRST
jgi:magnesium-transporting ATPase (P-type)